MITANKRRAHTLVELMIVAVLIPILAASAFGAFQLAKLIQVRSAAEMGFQRDADVMLGRIIKGGVESGGTFRLSEAVSYQINSIGDMQYTGTDGVVRRYFLSGDGRSVLYRHLVAPDTMGDETIYTVPRDAALELRFSTPAGAAYQNIVLEIDAAVSQNINGRNISGSATTYVNIRNHNS